MIDFHTHILPNMDDGAGSAEESAALLQMEAEQGVRHVFLTSHFYADEEEPASFLQRREASLRTLTPYPLSLTPQIHLASEVYYFPGLSDCAEIKPLTLGETGCILVEPPMSPWSESMLDDIEAIGPQLGLAPVIAHVDRYCRLLEDYDLFDRLQERKILIQVLDFQQGICGM